VQKAGTNLYILIENKCCTLLNQIASIIMANKKDDIEKEIEKTAKELKNEGVKGYEKLISQLNKQRSDLGSEIDKDYREARRYVRSNPEEGVLLGLIGGLALGLLLGRLGK
jgi:ElaB/YqjD/DUF883 family membrane-anchored ribosome-binding protein